MEHLNTADTGHPKLGEYPGLLADVEREMKQEASEDTPKTPKMSKKRAAGDDGETPSKKQKVLES